MPARSVLLLVASLALFAVPARADAPPRAPRATLVEVLRGGKQVLVFDRATGEYAVMKLGDSIQGFRIAAIEDDQMVLVGPGKPEHHFVIPLLDRTPVPPMKAPLALGDTELADPYATKAPAAAPAAPAQGAPAGEGVMDPYGPTEIPVVAAPEKSRALAPDASAGASPAASPSAPTSTPPAAPAPTPAPVTTPAAAAPPPAPAPAATAAATTAAPAAAAAQSATAAPSAPKAAAARSEKRRLSRKELDRALSDFAALTRDIKIERATGGGILVADLAKGSFAARAGIEKGDVVRRVAGHAIDTVDDAASAYAALLKAKQVVVELERHGARFHITYQLTD